MDYWGKSMIKYFKPFRQNDDGVAAIEFAIFAVPFFFLIMGIIEMGIMFGAATVLNGATEDAARLIRTGQVSGSNSSASDAFADEICNRTYALIDCDDITYHVVRMDPDDDFTVAFNNPSSIGLPPIVEPTDPSQLSVSTFNAGGPNDRIIVRVSYDYPLLTPVGALASLLDSSTSEGLANRPGNKRLLVSTAILQNEPYGT